MKFDFNQFLLEFSLKSVDWVGLAMDLVADIVMWLSNEVVCF